jgi:hypothetical protein
MEAAPITGKSPRKKNNAEISGDHHNNIPSEIHSQESKIREETQNDEGLVETLKAGSLL